MILSTIITLRYSEEYLQSTDIEFYFPNEKNIKIWFLQSNEIQRYHFKYSNITVVRYASKSILFKFSP